METIDVRFMTEDHFIVAIASWWLMVVLKAFIHERLIRHGVDPHKGQQKALWWILNAMASVCHAMIFPVGQMAQYFVILFFQVMSHMAIFAPLLNKLRGLKYFYLGLNSGGFDKYFVGRPKLYVAFYISCCILSILSIVALNIIFRP